MNTRKLQLENEVNHLRARLAELQEALDLDAAQELQALDLWVDEHECTQLIKLDMEQREMYFKARKAGLCCNRGGRIGRVARE